MMSVPCASLPRSPQAGFSLLELIIVMAVLGILVAFALPAYQDATTRAREAVLKEDLQRMREALEQFLTDKGAYPEALEDLVEFGYLRQIPVDRSRDRPRLGRRRSHRG